MGIFSLFKNAGRRAIFETEAIFSVRQMTGIDPESMGLHKQRQLTDEILSVLDSICDNGNKYDFTLLYFFFYARKTPDAIQSLSLRECTVQYMNLHIGEFNKPVLKYLMSRIVSFE